MTRFFEPISVSAVHIYHSALELSPLSSIVRRLYYCQCHTSSPRVVIGTPDAWNESMHISSTSNYESYTWSPCGQFIAAQTQGDIEIRDSLSSELLSTLMSPNAYLTHGLAYSLDGHSLASTSNTSLIIWDTQTGGVAKKIQCRGSGVVSLVWSLDGGTIGAILENFYPCCYSTHIYNVASGMVLSPGEFWSIDKPYLWAHGTSFQVMTVGRDDQACTIEIFDVGPVLTKIKIFCIKLSGQYDSIRSFSPATDRISVLVPFHDQIWILDLQNSECLFKQQGLPSSHCFSSDGSLFAASLSSGVHIWRYSSGCYTPWREFLPQSWSSFTPSPSPLQFSPNSLSILGCATDTLQVWRLDDPPIIFHPEIGMPLAVLSCSGTYIATGHKGNSTITITNLHSQYPSQFIDTGMKIDALALTGNILLVADLDRLVAWQLTEGGVVDGIFPNRRAGCSDSIWSISEHNFPMFLIKDQIVTIKCKGIIIHVYHMGTGETIKPAQVPPDPHSHQYYFWQVLYGQHYLHYLELDGSIPEGGWPVSHATLQEGWVKDPEGKHQLWIPVEWRRYLPTAGWLYNITTLWLNCQDDGPVIIMF